MRLPLAATTWSLAFLLVAWVPTCTQSCFCHLPPQSALDRKKGASTWEDSRVRAEVSWRNATEGRGLHYSPQSPSSVLPGAQPGECRGLSPRPAAPGADPATSPHPQLLTTASWQKQPILCSAAGCWVLYTNCRLPQSCVSPCTLQTRFREGKQNDPGKPLLNSPVTPSPLLPPCDAPSSSFPAFTFGACIFIEALVTRSYP